MKSTIKDMADSTFFWGIAKTYKLGLAVMETRWEMVNHSIKSKIDKKTTSLAMTISKKVGAIKPNIKTKAFFSIMSVMQKKGFNPADVEYWKAKGWTNGKRPWR